MKINKNIFVCLLLVLMLFLCVNATSAEDTLDNNLTSEDTTEIVASEVDISEIESNDLLSGSEETVLADSSDEEVISADETGGNTVVITNETYSNYFDSDGNLNENVQEGSTLDFQGSFVGKYPVYINKPVNVISSTGDALFDAGASYAGNDVNSFNIVAGADYTNVTGIRLQNVAFYVTNAAHVTVDNLYAVANLRGVGSGTGFVVFRNAAQYGVLKNSYLEQGGTGSSIVVIGFGAPYVTIDNNYINITGSSGNILGANSYVGAGVSPDHMVITNNIIKSHVAGSSTMYGFTLVGSYNLVENNTLDFKGSGVIAANMQWAPASIPRDPQENNTIRGNVFTASSVTAVKGTIVENNFIGGAVSVSGADVSVSNNNITGAVTIAKAATNTTFSDNYVKNTVTVNSNDNTITGNQISSTGNYAIDLKTSTGNTVEDNYLSSKDKMGDEAVNAKANNNVSDNKNNAIINIEAGNSWSGYKNNVTVTVINATGTVTIKINNKEYQTLPLNNGKVTFEINASEIEVGSNNVTAIYNGDENISGDNKDGSFYGLDNVVFQEVFFNFFDHDGNLKDDVPYDDLIFKGSFAKAQCVQYIKINKPVSISSDGASLSLMGIVIDSDNVIIDGLKFTATVNSATSALGSLINVKGDNVTLTNLDINNRVTRGDYDAIAINASNVNGLKILNNKIVFASVISTDEYYANAINLEGVSDALIDGNTITSTLPGLLADNYDWDYFMMGLNTVNPVRMKEVRNVVFSKNSIESSINNLGKTTPTIQALYIIGSRNVLFDSNSFRMVDTKSKSGTPTYLYAFVFGYDKNITVLNNDFYVSTTGGQDSAGSAYALQGVESEIRVIGNNITAISNGPNLGFYVASMMGGTSESYIANNKIDVTGYATTNSEWALVSGIEITNGNAYIYDNEINVYNKAGYVEGATVHGISYAQYMYGERSLDIQNNTVKVQGDYTIGIKEGTPANVTGNTLYAEKLSGGSSVAPGIDGAVIYNFPISLQVFATNAFEGLATTVTVIVPGETGNVIIKVNNKEYPVKLTDGQATLNISDYGEDTLINATYYVPVDESVVWNTTTFRIMNNVVEEDIFFEYFDEDGFLKENVPYDNLTFKGNFADLTDYIILDRPIVITGENAVLNEMGIVISSSDVKVDGLTLIATSSLGDLINVLNSNVELSNLIVSYVVDDEQATVINVESEDTISDVNILNNIIYFESHVTSDDSITAAIRVSDVEDVIIDNNEIDVSIPGLYVETYDWDYFMMGLTYVNPIIIREAYGIEFTNNNLNVEVNDYDSSYPTIQALYIVGSDDILIESNNITMIDDLTPAGTAIYLYGVESGWNDELVFKNNNFDIYTNGGKNGAGSAYALQFVATNAEIIANNITCESNGPNLGIYLPMGMGKAGNLLIENNNIEVIGSASSTYSNYALVSGIEAQTGYLKIYNNTIITTNKYDGYNEKYYVYGVSFAQSGVKTLSFDVEDNDIFTNGHYGVAFNYDTSNNIVTGNYIITKDLYGDDAVYIESGDNVVENNMPYKPKLSVSVENITVGKNAEIKVSIDKHATGDVVVIVNGKKYSLPIDNGSASIEIPNLTPSKYTVSVSYEGDYYVWNGKNSTEFTVSKIKSDAIITTTDLNIGEDVNVTITIDNVTGGVTVIADGNNKVLELNEGVAKFTMESIAAGDHYVTVIYMGDATHEFVINNTQFTIEKLPTEINLTDVSVDYGVDVPIEFTIAEDATGRVLFNINDNKLFKNLEDGKVSIELKDLAHGTYTVSISYEGDAKYLACDKTFNITVNGFDADLKANTSNIEVGQDAVINITINESVTGQTSITLGYLIVPVTFINGKATVTVPDLANGTYSVVVKFAGDAKYVADEVELILVVSKAALPEKINITTDIPEGTTSPEYSITLPEDATGNFTVTVDGKNYTAELVNGSATVKVENLTPGDHNISTSYSGDKKYPSFQSETQNVTIPKASIPGGENAINMTTPEGSSTPSYTINLPSDATGNLTVTVDGNKTYSQALDNGSATVTVPELTPGKHNITVAYSGDDKFSSISKNTTVTVPEPVVKLSENKNINMLYSAGTAYKVLVTVDGKAVSGENVVITFNGVTKTVKTDSKGYATYKIPTVKPKSYQITATYKDQTVKNTVKVSSIIKAKNVKVKKSKKVTKIKVTLKKVNGKFLKGKTLKLKIKGKTLKAKTNKKGVATFKVKKNVVKKLKVGKKYKYTVTYGKDTASKKITIKK